MKLEVYSLYDELVGAFGRPEFTNTPKKDLPESFRRMIVQDPQKAFNARDMVLYSLGTFDDQEGRFELYERPELLARLGDYFPKKKEEVIDVGN